MESTQRATIMSFLINRSKLIIHIFTKFTVAFNRTSIIYILTDVAAGIVFHRTVTAPVGMDHELVVLFEKS